MEDYETLIDYEGPITSKSEGHRYRPRVGRVSVRGMGHGAQCTTTELDNTGSLHTRIPVCQVYTNNHNHS